MSSNEAPAVTLYDMEPPSLTGTGTQSSVESKATRNTSMGDSPAPSTNKTGEASKSVTGDSPFAIDPILKMNIKVAVTQPQSEVIATNLGEGCRILLAQLARRALGSNTLSYYEKNMDVEGERSVIFGIRGGDPTIGMFFQVPDAGCQRGRHIGPESSGVHTAMFPTGTKAYASVHGLRQALETVVQGVPGYIGGTVTLIEHEVWAVYRLDGEKQRRVVGYLPRIPRPKPTSYIEVDEQDVEWDVQEDRVFHEATYES